MLGRATPLTLLGRCRRTHDHRPAAGLRERHAIASDGLVDQARDLRTSECGRALQVNPACLAGPLQQFLRIRQFLTMSEVQPDVVCARTDCKNALVPVLVRRIADDEAVAIFDTTSWAVGRRFRSDRRIAPMSRICTGANRAISLRNSASADRRSTADWLLPWTSTSTWTERRPE